MFLAIDVGNTHVVVGIFEKDELLVHWRFASGVSRTEDEYWALLTSLAEHRGVDLGRIGDAAISSVVPDLTPIIEKLVTDYLNTQPLIVTADLNLGIRILYDDPRSVGADRLCNAVAGFQRYGGPLVVVDFGTATTFDVVTENGDYLGGIIATGIETGAYLLHRHAAKLPKVRLAFPPGVVGRNTETAIQSGLMWGTVELVDGLLRRLKRQFGEKLKTVATGGLAKIVVPHLTEVEEIAPHLTLHGLRLIHARTRA